MIKSLTVAVVTFILLGLYYRQAESNVPVAERVASSVADPQQAARSAALAGINVAKQGLEEYWRSGLFAGRYRGAKYNAAVTVRDDRARVESLGRAIGSGGMSESYRLHVEVYRSPRDVVPDGAATAGYSYRIRPVSAG